MYSLLVITFSNSNLLILFGIRNWLKISKYDYLENSNLKVLSKVV